MSVLKVSDTTRLMIATLSCVLAVSSVAQAGLNDGLVSYWPMDDDFTDAAGSNDGTLTAFTGALAPANFTPGKFGQGIDLDGNQYVDAGTDASLDMSANDNVSISAWFRVDNFNSGWQALIVNGEGGDYRIARDASKNSLSYAGGTGDIVGSIDVNDDAIHHVLAISEAGVSTRLWVDGVLEATSSEAPDIVNDERKGLAIGGNQVQNVNRSWNGLIDDVAIWNRPLSVDEVGEIYDGGVANNSLGDLLTFVPEIPGNINGDLIVDRADVALFVAAYGNTAGGGFASGDYDGDGKTGLSDLALTQLHFGEIVPASPAAVPEPSACILCVMGLIGWLAFGCRRKKSSRCRV